jgi:hypothetical protein
MAPLRSPSREQKLLNALKSPPRLLITLPKKDPTTFVNYLRFVFRGTSMVSEQFLTSRKTDDIEKEQDDANPQLRHIKLAKVYGFCEFVGDMRGKDTVLDEMVKATHRPRFDGMTRAPGNEDIRRIYNQTLDNDPARRFLVDLTVDFDGAGWIVNKDREILPVDYVFDVAKSCLDIQGENGKASTSSKTYDSVNYSNV